MKDLVKQISSAGIVFKTMFAATNHQYSSENQLVDEDIIFGASITISKPTDKLEERAWFEIHKLFSFLDLPPNWDSYNAAKPSRLAIVNAIDFIFRLSRRQQFPFFTAPSPNGDVLIELRNQNVSLEFFFGGDGINRVMGIVNDEEKFEKELNETNEYCSLKWLYCPDGDCSNWE